MKGDRGRKGAIYGLILVMALQLVACSSHRAGYKRDYKKIWREIVNSEAWRNSLLVETSPRAERQTGFYTPVLDERNLPGSTSYGTFLEREDAFDKKYDALVTRAYYKIIAEAEEADERLRKEYLVWNQKQANASEHNRRFQKELTLVNKRYAAHQKMLRGLKSWNILSEYRSDDLRFFKNENREEVRRMYTGGKNESSIVRFLIFKLADLYHLEG
ncbi:MAG: hypothetical protein AAGA86_03480 [Bacteroidota bacterium]